MIGGGRGCFTSRCYEATKALATEGEFYNPDMPTLMVACYEETPRDDEKY